MNEQNVVFVGDNILDVLVRRDGHRFVNGVKLCLEMDRVCHRNQGYTPHLYLVRVNELPKLAIGVVVPFIV